MHNKRRGLSPRASYSDSDLHLSAKLVSTFADGGVSPSQCGGSPKLLICELMIWKLCSTHKTWKELIM
jgi:hypothetical protein